MLVLGYGVYRSRAAIPMSQSQLWPPKRVYYLNEDVYHTLEHGEADLDTIERAVIPRHYWQTNLCTRCIRLPDGDTLSSQFIDGIVRDARHVIVPAFDGCGYLIWSPATQVRDSHLLLD